jgi:HSP20 family protein
VGSDQKRKRVPPNSNIAAGVDGLFQGLGHLLRVATELAESARDQEPSGDARPNEHPRAANGLHAVYGVSVRIGARGRPVVAPFGNLRQDARKEPVVGEAREPLADLLDEGDHYLVIVELPGVEASDVHWAMRGDKLLVIQAGSGARAYAKQIHFGERVDATSAAPCYANGILELKLWKLRI